MVVVDTDEIFFDILDRLSRRKIGETEFDVRFLNIKLNVRIYVIKSNEKLLEQI